MYMHVMSEIHVHACDEWIHVHASELHVSEVHACVM